MLRPRFAATFVAFLLTAFLAMPSFAATFTFGGPSSGDPTPGDTDSWLNPKNWRPFGVPGAGDVAVIDSGFPVEVPGAIVVGDLNLKGDVLGSASGTLTVNGTFNWSGGSLAKITVQLPAGSVANLSSASPKALKAAIFNNAGMMNLSGTGLLNGDSDNLINNQNGGSFNVLTDGSPFTSTSGNAPTFNNLAGATFAKNAGGGTATITNWTFNNSGTISSSVGILSFNTTLNLNNGGAISGARTRITGGNVTATGTTTVQNGALMEIAAGSFTGNDMIPANLARSGSGLWEWTGSTIFGTVMVPAGSVFNLTGSVFRNLDGARLINRGTINLMAGVLNGGNGAVINNQSGAFFNVQAEDISDPRFINTFGTTPVFNNFAGAMLLKSAGTGISTVGQWIFNNSGTIGANSGILAFKTVLNLNDGTRFSGVGRTRISGISATLNGTATSMNTTVEINGGGSLTGGNGAGSGSLATVGSGVWEWTGGSLLGTLSITPGSVFNITGNQLKTLTGVRLTNNGTVNLRGTNLNAGNGAIFTNAEGAVFNTLIRTSGVSNTFGSRPTFINAGTLNLPNANTLALSANFQQTATGTLAIEIAGLDVAGQFNHLHVTGTATLAGALQTRLVNGFVPAPGTTLTALTHGSRSGSFSIVPIPFTLVYNADRVSLMLGSSVSLFLILSQKSLIEGASGTGTVVRNGPVTDPLAVSLSVSNGQVTVPATISIPAGAVSANFSITTVNDAVPEEPQIEVIKAKRSGFTTGNTAARITVLDNDGPALTVSLPSPIAEGASATGTITRNTPTTGPLIVTLSSNNPRLSVPVTATIPAGSASVSFTINAVENAIDESFAVTVVTASVRGLANGTAVVVVTDNDVAALTLTVPTGIPEGVLTTGNIARNTSDVSSPFVVTLNSNNTRLFVPLTVTILAGNASANFTLSVPDNQLAEGDTDVTVTASGNGFTGDSKVVHLFNNDSPKLTLNITPTTIAEGTGTATGTVARNTVDNTSPLTVSLSSNKPDNATVPATMTIPAGAASATFSITAPENTLVQGTQSVVLTASATGFTSSIRPLNVTDNDLPRIDAFSPPNGIPSPPLTVVITGANFTGATAVKFNGATAAFTVDSPTQISATLPTNASTGRITVTTPAGIATSATDFVVNPGIKLFTPDSGPPGTSVVIEGWGLLHATSVRFNGVAATFTVNGVQKITATAPANATTGRISITTPSGSVTSTSDFAVCALNVTSRVSVTRGALQPTGYIGGLFGDANYKQIVTLQNISATTIAGSLSLVLDDLTSGVSLANRSSLTTCAAPLNSPYLNVNSDNVLSPNETVTITLYFNAPSSDIGYQTRVLSGSGPL